MVTQSSEQLIEMHKAALETLQAVAMKSVEGFEKLVELNLQAAKAQLEESTEQAKALFDLKEPKAFAEFSTAGAQPAADKMVAYAKHVYEIANSTGNDIAKIFEKQFAESNKQFHAAIDSMAKTAPAGTEGMVTFVKSAVSAANSAYDQVNKATKQVVELAEANLAAATKAAPRAKKAA